MICIQVMITHEADLKLNLTSHMRDGTTRAEIRIAERIHEKLEQLIDAEIRRSGRNSTKIVRDAVREPPPGDPPKV